MGQTGTRPVAGLGHWPTDGALGVVVAEPTDGPQYPHCVTHLFMVKESPSPGRVTFDSTLTKGSNGLATVRCDRIEQQRDLACVLNRPTLNEELHEIRQRCRSTRQPNSSCVVSELFRRVWHNIVSRPKRIAFGDPIAITHEVAICLYHQRVRAVIHF